jgi:DNA adenine methylase Dam
MEVVQSACYLDGNKRELYPQIEPFLKGRKVIAEPFAGSGTVSLNASNSGLFERYLCNDLHTQMVNMHKNLNCLDWIMQCYESNKLYEPTKEDFLRLRSDYNADKSRLDLLYLIMMRSHGNKIRFNKSGGCNITYGERERFDLGRMLEHRTLAKPFEWYNNSFAVFLNKLEDILEITDHTLEDVVIYLDPPYQYSLAVYQDTTGAWTLQDDYALLSMIEKLHDKGAKIVMSNVFRNREKVSQFLIDWCEDKSDKFEAYHLKKDYGNSSAHKSDKKTDEVLIVSK